MATGEIYFVHFFFDIKLKNEVIFASLDKVKTMSLTSLENMKGREDW